MENLLAPAFGILFGLVGLVWGADRFVSGSAGAAKTMGISPLIIGLTIVSIGTSAPEIIVAINASLKGSGDLAVGNAIGSNLANIGLVLGITALISPLPTQSHLLKQDAPILIIVTLATGYILMDGILGRTEGFLLAAALIPILGITIYLKNRHPSPEEAEEGETIPDMPMKVAAMWFALGLVVLLIGAELLVWGAREVALSFGVSELIIGLTIIAIGTSLPELAASVMSAMRGHHDIALGNIFGSNLFNLLAVMSVPGIIQPLNLGTHVFYRDYLAMLGITLLLVAWIAWALYQQKRTGANARVSRSAGIWLLGGYLLYCASLIPA